MAEEIESGAKTDTPETDVVAGEESPSYSEIESSLEDDDGFFPTTNIPEVAKEEKQAPEEKVEEVEKTVETTTQKTETDSSKTKPFHEHEDWQRMVQSKNDANTRADALEKKMADLEAKVTPQQQEVINLMSINDEDLSDMIVNDPKKYTALVAQQLDSEQTARATKTAAKKSEAQSLADVQKGYSDYFADKPDGVKMVTDGTIQKFMGEHPGHNVISAYQELTSEARNKTLVDNAVKEAVEKSEKKIYANLKAKGIAMSPATPTSSTAKTDPSPKVKPEDRGSMKAAMARLWRDRNTG